MGRNHTKRRRLIEEMEMRIETPERFYHVTELGGRLVYTMDGETFQLILLNDLPAAQLLKEANVIHTYVAHKEYIKMFIMGDLHCDSRNNIFPSATAVTVQQLNLSSYQARTICAAFEVMKTEVEVGIKKHCLVVQLPRKTFNRAA